MIRLQAFTYLPYYSNVVYNGGRQLLQGTVGHQARNRHSWNFVPSAAGHSHLPMHIAGLARIGRSSTVSVVPRRYAAGGTPQRLLQLPANLPKVIADFEAATDSQATTREDIYTHLKRLQPWLASLPSSTRTQKVAKHKIGSRALNWVWSRGLENSQAFLLDFQLVSSLCLWLVAEKQDKYIAQWILIDVAPEVEQALGKTALTWRGALWRCLVDAEIRLTDRGGSADAAINRFFLMLRLRAENAGSFPGDLKEGYLYKRMSLFPATQHLATSLTKPGLSKTSPENFDKFAKLVRAITNRRHYRGSKEPWGPTFYAVLQVYHPSKPDPYPLLHLLKDRYRDDRRLGPHEGSEYAERTGFMASLSNTKHLLGTLGDSVNADWIASLLGEWESELAHRHRSGLKIRRPGLDTPVLGDGSYKP